MRIREVASGTTEKLIGDIQRPNTTSAAATVGLQRSPSNATCVFCTCIDNLGEEPRFDVCYQLRSTLHRHRLRLKIRLREEDVKCPSLSGVWPGFDWLERETYDMYGIQFTGHPDLRRIYMYEEFVGYPLRKDYPKEKRQPLVRRDDLPST